MRPAIKIWMPIWCFWIWHIRSYNNSISKHVFSNTRQLAISKQEIISRLLYGCLRRTRIWFRENDIQQQQQQELEDCYQARNNSYRRIWIGFGESYGGWSLMSSRTRATTRTRDLCWAYSWIAWKGILVGNYFWLTCTSEWWNRPRHHVHAWNTWTMLWSLL